MKPSPEQSYPPMLLDKMPHEMCQRLMTLVSVACEYSCMKEQEGTDGKIHQIPDRWPNRTSEIRNMLMLEQLVQKPARRLPRHMIHELHHQVQSILYHAVISPTSVSPTVLLLAIVPTLSPFAPSCPSNVSSGRCIISGMTSRKKSRIYVLTC